MRQTISFSIARVVAEAKEHRFKLREVVTAARASLVNVAGLTYPNMQGSSMWGDFAHERERLMFVFNEKEPTGWLRIEGDVSIVSTRTPLAEETSRPGMIFLESLAYELTYFVLFANGLIQRLGRPGTFRISLALQGFDEAHLDWSGFSEQAEALNRGSLLIWRLRGSDLSFEADDVALPASPSSWTAACQRLITELSFRAEGVRQHPIIGSSSSRLELSRKSIDHVIQTAVRATNGTSASESAVSQSVSEALRRLSSELVRTNEQLGSKQDPEWWRSFVDSKWPVWHRQLTDALGLWSVDLVIIGTRLEVLTRLEIAVRDANSIIDRYLKPDSASPELQRAQQLGGRLLDISADVLDLASAALLIQG